MPEPLIFYGGARFDDGQGVHLTENERQAQERKFQELQARADRREAIAKAHKECLDRNLDTLAEVGAEAQARIAELEQQLRGRDEELDVLHAVDEELAACLKQLAERTADLRARKKALERVAYWGCWQDNPTADQLREVAREVLARPGVKAVEDA